MKRITCTLALAAAAAIAVVATTAPASASPRPRVGGPPPAGVVAHATTAFKKTVDGSDGITTASKKPKS